MQGAFAILPSVACPAVQCFSTLSQKRQNFRGGKKVAECKMCVLIFSAALAQTFVIITRTERDMGKNVYWSLCSKGVPRQAEVALGVPGRLRPQIISTFGTTRVVGRQPDAPAAFTPGEIPGTHFQRLSRPQGTWFFLKEPRKKIPSDTTGNRSRDRPTSSAAP